MTESKSKVKKQPLKAIEAPEAEKQPGIGHNGSPEFIFTTVKEIEELINRQKELQAIIKDKKSLLKENGVNITALNQVLKERRMDTDVRRNYLTDCHNLRKITYTQADLFTEEGRVEDVTAPVNPVEEAKAKAGNK